MKQRILKFSVCDQRITTSDISVVADSKNYLAALFSFDCTWDGVEKTAVFSQGDKVYNVLLQDDMCRVPAEVITEGEFYVSVFGGDLITADKIAIEVTPSGLLEGVVPPIPTTDIYTQLVELVSSESAEAQSAAERAEMASQMSQDFAYDAKNHADMSVASAGQAMNSEHAALNYVVLAEQAVENATACANDAASACGVARDNAEMAYIHLTEAQAAADRAESAAQKLEWKTVLDVTLTDEQGGVNSLLLALSDAAAVAKARRIRFHINFPQATALSANTAWLAVILQDESGKKYTCNIIGGYNVAATANTTLYSTATIDVSDFGISSTFRRSYHSIFQPLNPHYSAPSNSASNARQITGGYPSALMEENAPYLKITVSSTTAFEKGTKIFMEVCEK